MVAYLVQGRGNLRQGVPFFTQDPSQLRRLAVGGVLARVALHRLLPLPSNSGRHVLWRAQLGAPHFLAVDELAAPYRLFRPEPGDPGVYYPLCMPVAFVIYYLIGRGKREAKTLFLALYAVTLFEIVTSSKDFLGQNNLATFDFLSQQVLHVGACLLVLFTLWPSKAANKPAKHPTTL